MRKNPPNRGKPSFFPPPPLLLVLVVHSEATSAARRLWSLGCLSNLQPKRGHGIILTRFKQANPIYNFEPQYRVTMLTIGLEQLVSSCSQRACLIYKCVQDEGGDRGWILWSIGRTKSQLFPMWIFKTVLGGDICYLGL